jgi:hypothetical protein
MTPGPVTVKIINDTYWPDISFIGVTSATTSNYNFGNSYIPLYRIEPYGIDQGVFYWMISPPDTPTIELPLYGIVFDVGFTVHDTCTVKVLDWDANLLASCTIVPEPASAVLMLLGASWMAARRKR